MMDLKTIYVVYENQDDYIPSSGTKWFFEDASVAREVAKGRGYYGSDATVEKIVVVLHEGSYFTVNRHNGFPASRLNLNPNRLEEVREDVLERLTEEEKIALGLE